MDLIVQVLLLWCLFGILIQLHVKYVDISIDIASQITLGYIYIPYSLNYYGMCIRIRIYDAIDTLGLFLKILEFWLKKKKPVIPTFSL